MGGGGAVEATGSWGAGDAADTTAAGGGEASWNTGGDGW